MKNAIEKIQGLTFGVEIEYTGLPRGDIALAIAKELNAECRYEGYHLANWVIKMHDGRKWQVESDASVTGSRTDFGGEVVSPILTIADIEMVQRVLRAIRRAGAKVNVSCGCHIHVGAKDMTAKQIQNLVKIFYKQEELIIRASGVRPERLGRYTRRIEKSFVDTIVGDRNMTMAKMADAYYANISIGDSRYVHYCKARYRTLNLHNLWYGGKHTVEFRFFEATLHAGEMRTNILLALTLVAYAKEAKAASGKGRRAFREASAKYDLRVFLLRLGWIGDEFKNPRKHMMKRLSGSAAWKNGRPQVAATTVAVTTAEATTAA